MLTGLDDRCETNHGPILTSSDRLKATIHTEATTFLTLQLFWENMRKFRPSKMFHLPLKHLAGDPFVETMTKQIKFIVLV